jgi:hypothetical protein
MGLSLKARKEIQKEHFRRYQQASKKEKGKMLDELEGITGQNRDYLAWVLTSYGKTSWVSIDGKVVKLIARAKKGNTKKRIVAGGRPRKYHEGCIAALIKIWDVFDRPCGARLVPFIRHAIDYLEASHDPDFGIKGDIRQLLLEISDSHADRLLQPARKRLALRGKSCTTKGSLLKSQIAVRTFFAWDERKPGFFEIDRVAHCGISTRGAHCWTLTATDIYSGWTELRALLNNAHRWVKEALIDIKDTLPFALYGLDSDNGGEFINNQLVLWCHTEQIQFTRGRPYRKNDNCFVEQKNGDRVRKTVGYFRYDTEAAWEALKEVYRYLNPFTNYWQPSIKISGKTKLENGKYKKHYERAKTPCQRLLECPDIPEERKQILRTELQKQNPVALKKALDSAVDRLLHLNQEKAGKNIDNGGTLAEDAVVDGMYFG